MRTALAVVMSFTWIGSAFAQSPSASDAEEQKAGGAAGAAGAGLKETSARTALIAFVRGKRPHASHNTQTGGLEGA